MNGRRSEKPWPCGMSRGVRVTRGAPSLKNPSPTPTVTLCSCGLLCNTKAQNQSRTVQNRPELSDKQPSKRQGGNHD